MGFDAVGATAAAFVARAATRRHRPPVRLVDGNRGWVLLARAGDALLLDEYGDLWWVQVEGGFARVVRPCWPEERRALAAEVSAALDTLRD